MFRHCSSSRLHNGTPVYSTCTHLYNIASKSEWYGMFARCHDYHRFQLDFRWLGDTNVRHARVLFILAVKFPQDTPRCSIDRRLGGGFQRDTYLSRESVSIVATSFYQQQASSVPFPVSVVWVCSNGMLCFMYYLPFIFIKTRRHPRYCAHF